MGSPDTDDCPLEKKEELTFCVSSSRGLQCHVRTLFPALPSDGREQCFKLSWGRMAKNALDLIVVSALLSYSAFENQD